MFYGKEQVEIIPALICFTKAGSIKWTANENTYRGAFKDEILTLTKTGNFITKNHDTTVPAYYFRCNKESIKFGAQLIPTESTYNLFDDLETLLTSEKLIEIETKDVIGLNLTPNEINYRCESTLDSDFYNNYLKSIDLLDWETTDNTSIICAWDDILNRRFDLQVEYLWNSKKLYCLSFMLVDNVNLSISATNIDDQASTDLFRLFERCYKKTNFKKFKFNYLLKQGTRFHCLNFLKEYQEIHRQEVLKKKQDEQEQKRIEEIEQEFLRVINILKKGHNTKPIELYKPFS
ncbi:hypothetical protein DSLASN_01660 [Desulfoluna limicola]|uniref:Uncharacterized protein n=1 Tax=Desulfoluna limicola TaxID=2810562 RepID=A0ABN6EW23_9BACT|nr:hypothetical protein [Desulfoluna limicola]BCS94534.1 hypothetical protein DSLASN_01660 [Desulfoluna limicola]